MLSFGLGEIRETNAIQEATVRCQNIASSRSLSYQKDVDVAISSGTTTIHILRQNHVCSFFSRVATATLKSSWGTPNKQQRSTSIDSSEDERLKKKKKKKKGPSSQPKGGGDDVCRVNFEVVEQGHLQRNCLKDWRASELLHAHHISHSNGPRV